MYYPYHPLLREKLSEFLDDHPISDPRLQSFLHSVNEFYEQASADRQELELLKAAYRHLDQFAGVVAHDIRAPLRSISSLALWICEDSANEISPQIQEKLQQLISKTSQLEKLINGIMAYSRAGESGKEKDYVNLRLLLENSIELLSPQTMEISIEGELPDIYTSRTPLHQVFLNIISNAMRHAGGKATLRIRCGYGYNGLVFAFLDNGPGIPKENLGKLFDLFGSNNNGNEYSGFGLSITKRLIEQNGGNINVMSEPGKGACFTFDWPCEILTPAKSS
jgi:signal transduction histidine kinase